MRADAQRNRARVLEAAETVLARDGLSASMREIAELAGVGVGTIYRQFPTKEVLYQAIVTDRMRRLAELADELAAAADPGDAFFEYFTTIVEDSTVKKVLVDALAAAGIDAKAGAPDIKGSIETLLVRAQEAGAVRGDVGMEELLALLSATCLAAQHHNWNADLRTRTLAVVFDGLRPVGAAHAVTGAS
ncbi:TetR/AcrR family transcriptional regulator [Nonomuraea jiangxiensis]|uniref:Regulatory protein, tetR family n=1 Tax=Nonomuraea jiangxiensis TaxID=633440 RepID=A0A1G8CGE5_9ACTN|nr:TetR/AcrR family transcriptional regulator [Nonomuraea jiangxiensis]SDH44535.1 regulatory protein, tetR family [Nonomuraea jiangxiensis]